MSNSHIAADCTIIRFGSLKIETTRENISALATARIIEWNHAILAWYPAKDSSDRRDNNWNRAIRLVT